MNTENTKTLLSDFVAKFKKATTDTARQAMVQRHILTHYAPLLKKKNVLDIMMQGCIATGKSGKHIDLLASKLNLYGAILVLYTDLEVDKVEQDGKKVPNMWEAYDLLKESGAGTILFNEIGEDINELLMVQELVLSTWQNENTTTAAYVAGLVENVTTILGTTVGATLKPLVDEWNALSAEEKQGLLNMLKNLK